MSKTWFARGAQGLLAVIVLGLYAAICVPSAGAQQDAAIAQYDPARTVIALLPITYRTGKKADAPANNTTSGGYNAVAELFQARGFSTVPEAAASRAVEEARVDLSSEQEYTPVAFSKLGQAARADLVAFVCVDQIQEGTKPASFFKGPEKQAHATIRLWLVDVRQEKTLVDGQRQEGDASGEQPALATIEISKPRQEAVRNAVKELLAEVLKAYPEKKK